MIASTLNQQQEVASIRQRLSTIAPGWVGYPQTEEETSGSAVAWLAAGCN